LPSQQGKIFYHKLKSITQLLSCFKKKINWCNAVNSSEVPVWYWSKTIFTVMCLLAWWQKLIMPWWAQVQFWLHEFEKNFTGHHKLLQFFYVA